MFRSIPGDCHLEFRDPAVRDSGWFECTAAVGGAAGEATMSFGMIPHYRHEMLQYFEELAGTTRWDGEKSWHSEYYEVELAATSAGETVTFEVLLRMAPGNPEGWDDTERATIPVAAERVARAGQEMRNFLGFS